MPRHYWQSVKFKAKNIPKRVIRIFPNDESALRLIGALLAEQNEGWQARKYLDRDEFNEWVAAQMAKQGNHIAALAAWKRQSPERIYSKI